MKERYKTPGQLIEEDLARLQWSQRELAAAMKTDPAIINKLIRGNQIVTPNRARELAEVTGRDPREYWEAQTEAWYYSDYVPQGFSKMPRSQQKHQQRKPAKGRKQ